MGSWRGPGGGETSLAFRSTRRAPLGTLGAKLQHPKGLRRVRPEGGGAARFGVAAASWAFALAGVRTMFLSEALVEFRPAISYNA